jgi:hypothetical protein
MGCRRRARHEFPGGAAGIRVPVEAACPSAKMLFMSCHAESSIVHQGVLDQGINLIMKPFDAKGPFTGVRNALGMTYEGSLAAGRMIRNVDPTPGTLRTSILPP